MVRVKMPREVGWTACGEVGVIDSARKFKYKERNNTRVKGPETQYQGLRKARRLSQKLESPPQSTRGEFCIDRAGTNFVKAKVTKSTRARQGHDAGGVATSPKRSSIDGPRKHA